MKRQDGSPKGYAVALGKLSDRILSFGESLLFALLVLVAVYLHYTVLVSARGLWRDEANTVNLAQSNSLFDLFDKLAFDSSGLSWLFTVRGWSKLGFDGDWGLRTLGCMVGLALFCALVWSGRKFGSRVPILAVGLFCVTPNAVVYGDSLRAYGCGAVFVVVTAGLVFGLTLQFTRKKALITLLAGILSVHSAFPNVSLVAALYGAGVAALLWERYWREAAALAAMAIATLASVVVYYPTSVRVSEWIMIKQQKIGWLDILEGFASTTGVSQQYATNVATTLALTGLVAAGPILLRKEGAKVDSRSRTAVFVAVGVTCSIAGQLIYFKRLSYAPYPWHFLPLFALLCLFADAGFRLWVGRARLLRFARLGGIALYANLILPVSVDAVQVRRTNMDLLAHELAARADVSDLIVVHPFFFGINFSRYYDGRASWTTLPQIEDHSVHRWDLIKAKMMEVAPEDAVIRKVQSTLREGHRVWVVGYLTMPSSAGSPIRRLSPAPRSESGWDENAYEFAWSMHLGQAIQADSVGITNVSVPFRGPINGFENVSCVVAKGRAQPQPAP